MRFQALAGVQITSTILGGMTGLGMALAGAGGLEPCSAVALLIFGASPAFVAICSLATLLVI
jgi:hypothetical protein